LEIINKKGQTHSGGFPAQNSFQLERIYLGYIFQSPISLQNKHIRNSTVGMKFISRLIEIPELVFPIRISVIVDC